MARLNHLGCKSAVRPVIEHHEGVEARAARRASEDSLCSSVLHVAGITLSNTQTVCRFARLSWQLPEDLQSNPNLRTNLVSKYDSNIVVRTNRWFKVLTRPRSATPSVSGSTAISGEIQQKSVRAGTDLGSPRRVQRQANPAVREFNKDWPSIGSPETHSKQSAMPYSSPAIHQFTYPPENCSGDRRSHAGAHVHAGWRSGRYWGIHPSMGADSSSPHRTDVDHQQKCLGYLRVVKVVAVLGAVCFGRRPGRLRTPEQLRVGAGTWPHVIRDSVGNCGSVP